MPSIAVNPDLIDEDYLHVVAAIMFAEGRLLIAQRQKGKHLQDYWEFPGGKREAGETAWQALQRELDEEIRIWPTRGKPFMRVYYRYPDRNILLDCWQVDAWRGTVSPGEKQRLCWIDLEHIDDYRYPPADIPVIDAIKNNAIAGTRRSP